MLIWFEIHFQGNELQDNPKRNPKKCPYWASRGDCTTNPGYMLGNCKMSCFRHQGGNF